MLDAIWWIHLQSWRQPLILDTDVGHVDQSKQPPPLFVSLWTPSRSGPQEAKSPWDVWHCKILVDDCRSRDTERSKRRSWQITVVDQSVSTQAQNHVVVSQFDNTEHPLDSLGVSLVLPRSCFCKLSFATLLIQPTQACFHNHYLHSGLVVSALSLFLEM